MDLTHNNLTNWQKKVLNSLLDRYEGSKSYEGTNKVTQNFTVDPVRIFPTYRDNGESVEKVDRFVEEMGDLASKGLVSLSWANGEILKIEANREHFSSYYELLGRKTKNQIREEERSFFAGWQEKADPSTALFRLCAQQIDRIDAGRKPLYTIEEAEPILRALQFIENNQSDILERELSIAVYGDTKLFEQKYRARVCRILKEFKSDNAEDSCLEDPREKEIAFLERHRIYANPGYVYVSGNAVVIFRDGRRMELCAGVPAALSDEAVQRVKTVELQSRIVMTVENLTSFNRLRNDKVFFLYLAGYHNTLKKKFLSLLSRCGSDGREGSLSAMSMRWLHFGDIDPDGFLILEHLRRETGLPFEPFRMGIPELKRYGQYTKKLEENDRVKAEHLIQHGIYAEVLQYMLHNDCKLEQEIISWLDSGDIYRDH